MLSPVKFSGLKQHVLSNRSVEKADALREIQHNPEAWSCSKK